MYKKLHPSYQQLRSSVRGSEIPVWYDIVRYWIHTGAQGYSTLKHCNRNLNDELIPASLITAAISTNKAWSLGLHAVPQMMQNDMLVASDPRRPRSNDQGSTSTLPATAMSKSSSGKAFSATQIGLYELIIRQLNDDGSALFKRAPRVCCYCFSFRLGLRRLRVSFLNNRT